MTILNMIRDIAGNCTFGLPFSKDKYNTTLASTTPQSLTVPSEYPKYIAIFGYEVGSTVWVAHNETAAIPGVSFSAATSEVNPVARLVIAGDVLSFITPDTNAQVGVVFYAIQ